MYPKENFGVPLTTISGQSVSAEKLLKDYVAAKIVVSNLEAQLAAAKHNLQQIEIDMSLAVAKMM